MELQSEIIIKLALDAAKQKSKTWLGLARDLGVGRTTVYSWKYGKFLPSCEQFLSLLDHIDVSGELLEAIQRSADAALILRPLCQSQKGKNDVRS